MTIGGWKSGAADDFGEVGFGDDRFLAKNQNAFEGIAEFADVAGPAVALHGFESFVLDLGDGELVFLAEPAEEIADEEGDVFEAFAEGRHVDADNVESVEQIGAEVLVVNGHL